MLSYFPAPYEDELLYSILARYHQWSGNSLGRETVGELFDDKTVRASVILPRRLGALAAKTEPFQLDFDTLLFGRTLFPYYAVFNSEANVQHVYRWAKESEPGSIQTLLGAFGNIQSPDRLRFCPQCYYEELRRHGQAYWHRLHQTPGVVVCECHFCRLLDSDVRYQVRYSKEYYIAPNLERIFPVVVPRALPPEVLQKAIWLAHDMRWLYQNYDYVRGVFAAYNYSFSDVFVYLLREMELATENGALRRERYLEAFAAFYPEEFLSLVNLSYQDDATPWVIRMCRTSRQAIHSVKYALMARFLCGSLQEFIDCIAASKITLNRRRIYTPVADEAEKRERYRAIWLKTREETPNATRNELRKANGPAYTWLHHHDHEWLYQNMPLAQKRGGNISNADWQERDDVLSLRADAAIHKLLGAHGKPIQITLSRIGKELGCLSLLRSKPHLLPKTMAVIRCRAEDNHQYRLRRINWAMQELSNQGLPVVKWRAMKLANVREEMWDEYWDCANQAKNELAM